MTINGEKREISGNILLSELLEKEGFETGRIAVELNEEIVPKASYGSTYVSEADKLEVVSFVGGG